MTSTASIEVFADFGVLLQNPTFGEVLQQGGRTALLVNFARHEARAEKFACPVRCGGADALWGSAPGPSVSPRLGLRTQLWRHVRFPQRNNRYHISETLLAILYPIVLGMERLETTESLKHHGVLQYLTHLPGYPDPTSLRRFLQRFVAAGRPSVLRLQTGTGAP